MRVPRHAMAWGLAAALAGTAAPAAHAADPMAGLWTIEQVRERGEWLAAVKKPEITVLVEGVEGRSSEKLALEWLTATDNTPADGEFAVTPMAALAPVPPPIDFRFLLDDETRSTPDAWKMVQFKTYVEPEMKDIAIGLYGIAADGIARVIDPGAVKAAQVTAIAVLDGDVDPALEGTKFAMQPIPALVRSKTGIDDSHLGLARLAMTKDLTGKLYAGGVEVAMAKAKELLSASGWHPVAIDCVTSTNPQNCIRVTKQVAEFKPSAPGLSPDALGEWYHNAFPHHEESWIKKVLAPRTL